MTSIDDHANFVTVKKALRILGFSEEEAGVCGGGGGMEYMRRRGNVEKCLGGVCEG